MNNNLKTNFTDEEYLQNLVTHLDKKVKESQTTLETLQMLSSASMNWIADFILDQTVEWNLEELKIDSLYLTGTNPKWNLIIIDKCERSPKMLKEYLDNNPEVKDSFNEAVFDKIPVLVRLHEEKLAMVDGMHRVIAAIRDGHKTIKAFVARPLFEKKPEFLCEPHVVYDLMKAYHKGTNKNREGLITALRYLRKSYTNVDYLLKERFGKNWVPNDEIQEIIKDALKD